MNMNIGIKIKTLRSAKNLTQADLAKRINMTTSAVSSYEVNDRQPSYDVLIRIAKLFNVTTDYLLGLDDKDMIDVSDLTVTQREHIQRSILLYKKFNILFVEKMNLHKTAKGNIDAVTEVFMDVDMETFIEGIKQKYHD